MSFLLRGYILILKPGHIGREGGQMVWPWFKKRIKLNCKKFRLIYTYTTHLFSICTISNFAMQTLKEKNGERRDFSKITEGLISDETEEKILTGYK